MCRVGLTDLQGQKAVRDAALRCRLSPTADQVRNVLRREKVVGVCVRERERERGRPLLLYFGIKRREREKDSRNCNCSISFASSLFVMPSLFHIFIRESCSPFVRIRE